MKALFKCTYNANKKRLSEMYKIHFFSIFKNLHPQEKCDIIDYFQHQLQKEYDINKEIYYDELNARNISEGFYETTYHQLTR